MNGLFSAAVALTCLLSIGWSRARNGEYCSPASVVVAAWGGTFALYLLKLLPFEPVSTKAAAILLLGVSGLLVGVAVGRRLVERHLSSHSWRNGWAPQSTVIYASLGVVGTAWYIWLVDRHLGSQALWHDAASVRYALVTYEIPSRFLFLQFFCMAASLLAAALAVAGVRLSWWRWSLVAAAFAGTFITTDRTQFFIVLLTVSFMWLYRQGPSLSLARMGGAVGLAGVLLLANFLVVGYWVGKSAETVGTAPWLAGRSVPAATSSVAGLASRAAAYTSTAYLYATGSYPAFSVYVEGNHARTHGAQIFYPLARLLQRLGMVKRGVPYPIPESAVIVRDGEHSIGFNAYTFLYYPYQDFGVIGVGVYSLLVGLLAGMAYERVRRARSSPLHLLIAGQVSMALALSVFVNKFNNTAAWYVFTLTIAPFLLPVVWRAANRPRRPKQQ